MTRPCYLPGQGILPHNQFTSRGQIPLLQSSSRNNISNCNPVRTVFFGLFFQ